MTKKDKTLHTLVGPASAHWKHTALNVGLSALGSVLHEAINLEYKYHTVKFYWLLTVDRQ